MRRGRVAAGKTLATCQKRRETTSNRAASRPGHRREPRAREAPAVLDSVQDVVDEEVASMLNSLVAQADTVAAEAEQIAANEQQAATIDEVSRTVRRLTE